ncbi:MAG: Wzz/FepE/Etk N-terminal domain-containing protein [Endomicrobia bacterium]|nr:Wzz/FepE/Etk N-terminal domain-containing protein [Endomicrobiia bacterium]
MNDEKEISIIDIIKFFIRNKNIIFYTTFLFFILGIIFALFQKKTYTAEAAIMVLGIKPKVTFEPKIQLKEIGEDVFQQIDERKKTVVEFLNSPYIISEVIEKLKRQGLIKHKEISVENFTLSKNTLVIETKGEIIKVKVKLEDKNLAKHFADELVKTVTDKMFLLFNYDIPKELLKTKLEETKQEYEKAQKRYNMFIQKNKITELLAKLSQLETLYNYYINNIVKLERLISEANGLKEQLQKSEVSSVGEFANALALLKFKSSIFTEGKELPVNVELKEIDKEILKFKDLKLVMKEIDQIIEVLEKLKKEYQQKLEDEKYEQKIQQLKKEIEEEKNKEKQLIKDRDLIWESLLTLERKQKEMEISNGISENIPVKIAYLSNLPEKPDPGKRKVIVILFTIMGFSLATVISLIKETIYLLK